MKEVKNSAQIESAGADNLLVNYLNVQPGEQILLVLEPDESLYHKEVSSIINARCRELGAQVEVITAELIQHARDFPNTVSNSMRQTDHTIFLSRLGDYVRFLKLPGKGSRTTSYTYTAAQLASPFASLPHQLMATLRDKLEAELLSAQHWRITCPLGTDISGSFCWPSLTGGEDSELQVTLFPVSTFKPVPCDSATGTVALSRWLMPGGSPKIESPGLSFEGVVHCEVQDGQIQSFHGSAATQVSRHYDRIASTLGINRNCVHSWHLGINPQTRFSTPVDQDFDRWCATSFGSPRYLHFHTCGDEPPGEAAWSLFNCDVFVDSDLYWQNGEFIWLQRPDNRKLIDDCANAEPLLLPSEPIGI